MTQLFTDKQTNIYKYPDLIRQPGGTITIGDLHGNTVKLLYFLVQHGVVGFKNCENPEEAYLSFVELYEEFADVATSHRDNAWTVQSGAANIQRLQKEVENLQSDSEYFRLKNMQERNEEEEKEFKKLDRSNAWLEEALEKKERASNTLKENALQYPLLIERFNAFMEKVEIRDNLVSVRLIGDEFADRGSCDYFTLRLLSLLKDNQVKVTTLLSNHSNEFIVACENLANNKGFTPSGQIVDGQKQSFLGLKEVLKQKLVSETEITNLVNFAYKPTLKILDYTFTADGIRLFTHAPVAFDAIRHLAKTFGVVYNDSTKEDLGRTIDKINTNFQQIVQENKVHLFVNTKFDPSAMSNQQIAAWPLMYFMWNRFTKVKDTIENRPPAVNGYAVGYTHGHDSYQSPLEHVINLDTACGKESRTIQNNKIALANEDLNNPRCTNKKPAQEYLADVHLYKILDSNEIGLNQTHDPDLIDKEFEQATNPPILSPVMRKGLITGAFILGALFLSILIGGVLVGTGLFAPFGATLLGGVYLCLAIGGGATLLGGGLGFGVAQYTQEELVVDTRVSDVSFGKNPMTALGSRVESNKVLSENQSNQNNTENLIVSEGEQNTSEISLKSALK